MERYRVGIVIPALNEGKTIGLVVSNAAKFGRPIVVDDGSVDNTCDLARCNGAEVVRHEVNRGYDQALNTGFARAEELECEYVITIDADGQHPALAMARFIQVLDNGADVVVGIRDRRQRFAESIFGWAINTKWGIRDPLCGMKAYRLEVYKELGYFDSYESIGTELMLYAAKCGKNIMQVSVNIDQRKDSPRFGNRFSTNRRILRALWLGMYPVLWSARFDIKTEKVV